MSVWIVQEPGYEPGAGPLLWQHTSLYRWVCFMCRRRGRWTGEEKANDDGLAHEDQCRSNIAQAAEAAKTWRR